MKIDLLYFDGCPSWQTGLENLRSAIAREGLQADIHVVPVTDDEQAASLRFLGSPSYIVDGEDLWPEIRAAYHLSCRVYMTPEGIKGAPTIAMLQEKLRTNHSVLQHS
ncbi:MAG: DF family (seleno)protein [Anaerolineales bacterium]